MWTVFCDLFTAEGIMKQSGSHGTASMRQEEERVDEVGKRCRKRMNLRKRRWRLTVKGKKEMRKVTRKRVKYVKRVVRQKKNMVLLMERERDINGALSWIVAHNLHARQNMH